MKIENWCELNRLDFSYIENNSSLIKVDDRSFVIIQPKNGILFDEDFDIQTSKYERDLINEYKVENYLFQFGDDWFYSLIDDKDITLNPFKYIGKAKLTDSFSFPYLGVHGKYDLCNGSRDYEDWIKKARFLGIDTLGLCETNTLAGTLSFQMACKKMGMGYVIGEEVLVRETKTNQEFFVKLYVKNENGWHNLLLVNTEVNVHNEEKVIEFDRLLELSGDLVCVTAHLNPKHIKRMRDAFEHFYFQFDPVEYLSDEKDKEHLQNLKDYINNYLDEVEPVIICDSYYLDVEDSHIRHTLNKIGKTNFYNQSANQYFKSTDDIFCQTIPLFKEDDERLDVLINKSLENLEEIKNLCDFTIETGVFHLPRYELTNIEKKTFDTNEDLFWHLISEAVEEKLEGKVDDIDVYWERIEKEADVLSRGGFIDYFLVLWDIVEWCGRQGIMSGIGRGSAAGSLIAYLFGLVKVDPIKYDLIFERFLNESRMKSSAPDIDMDFPGNRRDEIKRYIEQRYGQEHVASIGTYGTLKMRAAMKDLARQNDVPPQLINYFTAMVDEESSFTDLFKQALEIPRLKKFIKDNAGWISTIPLIFGQPKNQSIHAAGVVITPKEDDEGREKSMYTWMPITKRDGVLITEWEMYYIDEAGFLKADILGIRQLEKFTHILDLINKECDEKIEFEDIPLNDEPVFELFREGLNEDVFQFGAAGLKGYCQLLKPDNIEDLIATVALYRPGPMEIGAHKKYAKIKNGESFPEYLLGTKEITQPTYSNIVYQEQVMSICVAVGGFSLAEADDVRRAMGKKNLEQMSSYQEQFADNAIKIGYNRVDAIQLWNNLESFAGYAFNRSHATAYAFTGYYCQWFKHHYPLQFWLTSLKYSRSDQLPMRINEISKTSSINILSPDINHSQPDYVSDTKTNNIYWSLTSVKFISEKASESIMAEREAAGTFDSLEDFYYRVEKKTVNKRVILNLILCGAFDQIYELDSSQPEKRYELVKRFCELTESDIPEEFTDEKTNWKSYFYTLKQKQLCGLGYIDFQKIHQSLNIKEGYVPEDRFFLDEARGNSRCVGGVIADVLERSSKKGPFGTVTLDCNNNMITCIMWAEIWPDFKEQVSNSKGKIMFIGGEIKHDSFRQHNVLQTNRTTQINIV